MLIIPFYVCAVLILSFNINTSFAEKPKDITTKEYTGKLTT